MSVKSIGRHGVLAVFAAVIVGMTATAAGADALLLDIESYTTGLNTVDGQDGWEQGDPALDHEFVNNTYGYTSFGTKSLRVSNAYGPGHLAHTLTKSLVDEAGEPSAVNGGESGGTRQRYFTAEFDLASTVPSAQQPGLRVDVSPDAGGGGRMSLIRIEDMPVGIQVGFFDYENGFVFTTVASGLDRSVPHTIGIRMLFKPGAADDLVQVLVDGVVRHTGGSWEEFFRASSAPTNTVDSLLIHTRSTAPATAGNGFLFDNIKLCSAKSLGQCP